MSGLSVRRVNVSLLSSWDLGGTNNIEKISGFC